MGKFYLAVISCLVLSVAFAQTVFVPQPTDEATHILKCKVLADGGYYCVRVYSSTDTYDPDSPIDLEEIAAAEQAVLTGGVTEVRNFNCGVTAHCEVIGTNPITGEVYVQCRCGGP